MKRYIDYLIRSEEHRVDEMLFLQIKDKNDLCYGLMRGDVIEAKPTIYMMATALALYLNSRSRYYKSEKLMEALQLAADGVARVQRKSGYIDYPCCNFFSAPDTSFCYKRLNDGYRLMKKYQDVADTTILQKKYLAIMRMAAEAIRDGGFHTPNHRWGICAALMQAAKLFADDTEFAKSLMDRTVLYLQEGIDGNSEGEYAERSTGNYNAVVNNAMMAMYQCSKDVKYLGYVERNLNMMMYYIEPNDMVFTQNSTRQDQGKEIFMDKYLYQYLYLLAYDGTDGFIKLTPEEHARFDGAAHQIIKGCAETGRQAPNCLHLLMIYDKTLDYTFENCGFLKTYHKLFKEAGVLRVKKENYSYTVMKNRSAFLYFNVNGLEAFLKIGESYCEIRNFVPDEMDVQEGKTVLSHTARGWYYLPWKEKQNTSDWWQMDHKKRDLMITSDLHTQVVITELADGLEISVDTDGLERLPLRMELCVPSQTTLENDHFCMETVAGKSMVLSDDYVTMTKGLTSIEFGPGACEHHFKGHYSGEEVNTDGYTIYCNTYTPTKRVYTLKVKQ
ncbi:hypothetical protein [Anthropogastromicrobium sp.]|uniref:hypothetical protein n=1 Tax=Anthropogastromicrobium sp. TaxID=2981649 RepID=UPI003078BBFB